MTTILSRRFVAIISRTVLATIISVTGLFLVIEILDNLGRQGTGGAIVNIRDALLSMPAILIAALPACCGTGCAIGLAIMDSRTEFALLRIMGTSKKRILGWIAAASVIWIIVFFALTEFLLTGTAEISREIEIRRSGSLLTSDDGVWLKTKDGYARIGAISSGGILVEDLLALGSENNSVSRVWHSDLARHGDDGWNMFGVTEANLGTDGVWRFSRSGNRLWTQGPDPELLNAFSIKPENLSLGRLVMISSSLRELGENTVAIDIILWSRIFDAISIAILMLGAFALVRNRTKESPTSVRAVSVAALIAMISYYYLQVIVRQHAMDANWPAIVGAALPALVFVAIVATYITRRQEI